MYVPSCPTPMRPALGFGGLGCRQRGGGPPDSSKLCPGKTGLPQWWCFEELEKFALKRAQSGRIDNHSSQPIVSYTKPPLMNLWLQHRQQVGARVIHTPPAEAPPRPEPSQCASQPCLLEWVTLVRESGAYGISKMYQRRLNVI